MSTVIKPPQGVARMCWNIYKGQYKKRYEDPKVAAQEAASLAEQTGDDRYGVYTCTHCQRYHVGRERHYWSVVNSATFIELGPRAAWNMNAENDGTPEERIDFIVSRGQRALERAKLQ